MRMNGLSIQTKMASELFSFLLLYLLNWAISRSVAQLVVLGLPISHYPQNTPSSIMPIPSPSSCLLVAAGLATLSPIGLSLVLVLRRSHNFPCTMHHLPSEIRLCIKTNKKSTNLKVWEKWLGCIPLPLIFPLISGVVLACTCMKCMDDGGWIIEDESGNG